jgi:hypothetical protein
VALGVPGDQLADEVLHAADRDNVEPPSSISRRVAQCRRQFVLGRFADDAPTLGSQLINNLAQALLGSTRSMRSRQPRSGRWCLDADMDKWLVRAESLGQIGSYAPHQVCPVEIPQVGVRIGELIVVDIGDTDEGGGCAHGRFRNPK